MSAASEKQKTKKQKNKTATNIVPFTFPAAPYCHAVFFFFLFCYCDVAYRLGIADSILYARVAHIT